MPALTLRRERAWARLKDADFLTINEKRAAAGFGPLPGGDALITRRGARIRDAGVGDGGAAVASDK